MPKLGVTVKLAEGVLAYANYARFPRPDAVPGQQLLRKPRVRIHVAAQSRPQPRNQRKLEGGLKLDTNVSLQLAAFHADYDDFISQQVVGGSFTPFDPAQYQYVNFDAVRSTAWKPRHPSA